MADSTALTLAGRLGFCAGQVVLEIGYHDDVDQTLREDIEKVTGQSMVDEDRRGWVDVVLVWHREGDGDLADTLADTVPPLTDGGYVLILTPKPGWEGHVAPSEAVPVANPAQTPSVSAGGNWTATRLMDPRTKH